VTYLDFLALYNVVDLDFCVYTTGANVRSTGYWIFNPSTAASRCFVLETTKLEPDTTGGNDKHRG
jgi:hypothetical protein